MGIMHKVTAAIDKFRGIEKSKSDLVDKPGYLSEMTNAKLRSSGALSKRKGWHSVLDSGVTSSSDSSAAPVLGLCTWKGKSGTADSLSSEVLLVKKDLHRVKTERLTIGTTHSGNMYCSLKATASGEMQFKIIKSFPSAEFTLDLGTGKGHSNDKTMYDFKSWIEGLTLSNGDPLGISVVPQNFTTAFNNNSGLGALPAAFMLPFTNKLFNSNAGNQLQIDVYYQEAVPTATGTSTSFFQGLENKYNNDPNEEFENVCTTNMNGCTYFATGYDNICKYDGSKIYRAGLPNPLFSGTSRTASLRKWTMDEVNKSHQMYFKPGASSGTQSLLFGIKETVRDSNYTGATGQRDPNPRMYYMIVYEYTDAQGNLIRSNNTPFLHVETPSSIERPNYTSDHRRMHRLEIPTLKAGTGEEGEGFDVDNVKILIYRTAYIDQATVNAASFYLITQEDVNGTPTMEVEINTPWNKPLSQEGDISAFGHVNNANYIGGDGLLSDGTDSGTFTFENTIEQGGTWSGLANIEYKSGPLTPGAASNANNKYKITNGKIDNDPTRDYIYYYDFTPHEDEDMEDNVPGSEDDLIFPAVLNEFIVPGDYPEGRHDPPGMYKYITNHQGCLVAANKRKKDSNGNIVPDSPTEVAFSLVQFNNVTGETGSEYFPSNTNTVLLDGVNGAGITAIKTLKDNLYVFHENTISTLSGDISILGNQALRHDLLSAQGEIGTESSHCLQEYETNLTFLSDQGFMTVSVNNPAPAELSVPIRPLVRNTKASRPTAMSFFKADDNIMGFYLPFRDKNYPSDVFVEENSSFIYVFDVKHKAWHRWNNIDISGGVVRKDSITYFVSRNKEGIYLNVFKQQDDVSDFADHASPIDTEIITSWESLRDPAVFKKYLRMNLLVTDSNEAFDGGTFSLDIFLRKDFSTIDIGPTTVDSSLLGGWGLSPWGIPSWGDRNYYSVTTKLFGKGKSICFKFKNNNVNENILISGYLMEVAAPYKPEIKE